MKNNREIKFRAWHKVEKKMYKPFSLYESNPIFQYPIPKYYKLIQYTGFKAEGVEIYDGYIVKTPHGIVNIVFWADGFWGYSHKEEGIKVGVGYLADIYKELEVIGNIYENPELLEKQQ